MLDLVAQISGLLVVVEVDHILNQTLDGVLVVVVPVSHLHIVVLVVDRVMKTQDLTKMVKTIVDLVLVDQLQDHLPVMEELVVLVLSSLLIQPDKYLKT